MKNYEFKNPFWLYEDNKMRPRIKKELKIAVPIILTVFSLTYLLLWWGTKNIK